MKLYKSLVTDRKGFEYAGDIDYSAFDLSPYFPLLKIPSCYVEIEAYRDEDEKLFVYVYAEAELILSDARDASEFPYPLTIEEEFQILDSIEEEGEGYVYSENAIELDALVLSLLKSALPLAPRKEDSKLPPSQEDCSFFLEGEEPKEGDELVLEEEKDGPEAS